MNNIDDLLRRCKVGQKYVDKDNAICLDDLRDVPQNISDIDLELSLYQSACDAFFTAEDEAEHGDRFLFGEIEGGYLTDEEDLEKWGEELKAVYPSITQEMIDSASEGDYKIKTDAVTESVVNNGNLKALTDHVKKSDISWITELRDKLKARNTLSLGFDTDKALNTIELLVKCASYLSKKIYPYPEFLDFEKEARKAYNWVSKYGTSSKSSEIIHTWIHEMTSLLNKLIEKVASDESLKEAYVTLGGVRKNIELDPEDEEIINRKRNEFIEKSPVLEEMPIEMEALKRRVLNFLKEKKFEKAVDLISDSVDTLNEFFEERLSREEWRPFLDGKYVQEINMARHEELKTNLIKDYLRKVISYFDTADTYDNQDRKDRPYIIYKHKLMKKNESLKEDYDDFDSFDDLDVEYDDASEEEEQDEWQQSDIDIDDTEEFPGVEVEIDPFPVDFKELRKKVEDELTQRNFEKAVDLISDSVDTLNEFFEERLEEGEWKPFLDGKYVQEINNTEDKAYRIKSGEIEKYLNQMIYWFDPENPNKENNPYKIYKDKEWFKANDYNEDDNLEGNDLRQKTKNEIKEKAVESNAGNEYKIFYKLDDNGAGVEVGVDVSGKDMKESAKAAVSQMNKDISVILNDICKRLPKYKKGSIYKLLFKKLNPELRVSDDKGTKIIFATPNSSGAPTFKSIDNTRDTKRNGSVPAYLIKNYSPTKSTKEVEDGEEIKQIDDTMRTNRFPSTDFSKDFRGVVDILGNSAEDVLQRFANDIKTSLDSGIEESLTEGVVYNELEDSDRAYELLNNCLCYLRASMGDEKLAKLALNELGMTEKELEITCGLYPSGISCFDDPEWLNAFAETEWDRNLEETRKANMSECKDSKFTHAKEKDTFKNAKYPIEKKHRELTETTELAEIDFNEPMDFLNNRVCCDWCDTECDASDLTHSTHGWLCKACVDDMLERDDSFVPYPHDDYIKIMLKKNPANIEGNYKTLCDNCSDINKYDDDMGTFYGDLSI